MECKIFGSQDYRQLERDVNEWLKTHVISPESMRFQATTVTYEDSVEFIPIHTIVLFYVPLRMI